jgi:sulfoxide reductase heme-binding subunit YedZ
MVQASQAALAARSSGPKASLVRLTPRTLAAIKAIAFALALAPLARLVAGVFMRALGTNPVEVIIRSLGTWALVFLCITLAVTPLRRFTGWHWLARLRRMFGLYAFFYAVLHFTSYIWLDQDLDFVAILHDLPKRPFITIGFTSLLLMVPLAATSTDAMVRRLGSRQWIALHRFVYLIAAGGVVHFWWLVKRDITEPAIYAAVVAVLLGYRAIGALRIRRR